MQISYEELDNLLAHAKNHVHSNKHPHTSFFYRQKAGFSSYTFKSLMADVAQLVEPLVVVQVVVGSSPIVRPIF
jgi:hypothetical protein